MILAYLILDPSRFSLFEYFPNKKEMDTIISQIDKLDKLEGDFSIGELNYHLAKFTSKLSYCLVYVDEELDPHIKDKLPEIANNVMKGDKLALRQLLQSKRILDLGLIN